MSVGSRKRFAARQPARPVAKVLAHQAVTVTGMRQAALARPIFYAIFKAPGRAGEPLFPRSAIAQTILEGGHLSRGRQHWRDWRGSRRIGAGRQSRRAKEQNVTLVIDGPRTDL